MKFVTNNIVVNVNAPFDLEDWGYQAANLLIEWIPKISQVLFNVEISKTIEVSITLNSSLTNDSRGNFTAARVLMVNRQ